MIDLPSILKTVLEVEISWIIWQCFHPLPEYIFNEPLYFAVLGFFGGDFLVYKLKTLISSLL